MQRGDVIDSRYRVDRALGAGGMGAVFAVTDLKLPRQVALKVLHDDALANPVQIARFEREARAAAMLKSEHVVRTFDVGRLASGTPYIVMELLTGRDLEDLTRVHPLPCATAIDYVLQACTAIAEAHANGIVHRDLKPQNLFLAERVGRPPIVKVLDFGISKVEGDLVALTKTRDVLGTPLYMAPEQLRSAKATDARTDIWALGAILYRLVTGRLPFEADTVAALCGAIIGTEPTPLRELRPDAPDALVRAVDRCLQKDPAARVPTVAELARLLDPELQSPLTSTISLAATQPMTAPLEPPKRRPRWLFVAPLAVVAAGAGAYAAWPRPAPPRVREVREEPPVPAPSAAAARIPPPPAPSDAPPAPPKKSGHASEPHAHRRPPRTTSSAAPGPAEAPAEEDDSLPDMRK